MSIVHQPNCGEFDDYDHVNADHHHHHDLNEGHLISAPCRSLVVVSLMIMIMSMLIIIIIMISMKVI